MFSFQRLSLDLTHLFQFGFREDFRWQTNLLHHLSTVGHLMTILTILLLMLQVNFPQSRQRYYWILQRNSLFLMALITTQSFFAGLFRPEFEFQFHLKTQLPPDLSPMFRWIIVHQLHLLTTRQLTTRLSHFPPLILLLRSDCAVILEHRRQLATKDQSHFRIRSQSLSRRFLKLTISSLQLLRHSHRGWSKYMSSAGSSPQMKDRPLMTQSFLDCPGQIDKFL